MRLKIKKTLVRLVWITILAQLSVSMQAQSNEARIVESMVVKNDGLLWLTDYNHVLCGYLAFDYFSHKIVQITADGSIYNSFNSDGQFGDLEYVISLGYLNDSLIIMSGGTTTNVFNIEGKLITRFPISTEPFRRVTTLSKKFISWPLSEDQYCMIHLGFNETEEYAITKQFYKEVVLMQKQCVDLNTDKIISEEFFFQYPRTSIYVETNRLYPMFIPEVVRVDNQMSITLPHETDIHGVSMSDLKTLPSHHVELSHFNKAIFSLKLEPDYDSDKMYIYEQMNPYICGLFYSPEDELYVLHYKSGLREDEVVYQREDNVDSVVRRKNYIQLLDRSFNKVGEDIRLPKYVNKISYVHSIHKILCEYLSDDPDSENKYVFISLEEQ